MIWDVRARYSLTRRGEFETRHVAYEDAPSAEAAVAAAARRGLATEAHEYSRQRYVDLVAVEPVYYGYDNNDEIAGFNRTLEGLLAHVIRYALVPIDTLNYVRIEIGDTDGPDAPVGTLYQPGEVSPVERGFLFEIDAPAYVGREWRSTEWVERRIADHLVTTTPVASWFIRQEQAPEPTAPGFREQVTFRERMMASPVREDKREGYVLPVMSLEESQAARAAGLELDETKKRSDEPTSRTRFELLEMNGRRRRVRRNPDPEIAQDDEAAAADKYEEFHRFKPKKVDFVAGFTIPKVVYKGGKAKWVTYRSDKVDPSTLKKPRAPIDYIHEHDAGVVCYLAEAGEHAHEAVDVPEEYRNVGALVRLGTNLGFCFVDADGEEIEAVSQAPMPELYSTPDGKCLLVVQSKRSVIAMEWGGALGVFARGIDG